MRLQKTPQSPTDDSDRIGNRTAPPAQASSVGGQVIIVGAARVTNAVERRPIAAAHAPAPAVISETSDEAPEQVWIALEDMLRKREAAKRAAAMRLHPSRRA